MGKTIMSNHADLASELRRHARKIAHPAGDTPAVMEQAAEALESMAQTAEIVAWHICIRGCDGSADWCELGADRPKCPPEADALALVYALPLQTKWCPVHQHYKPCEHTAKAPAEIARLQETLKRQDKAHHAEVQEQVAAERERSAKLLDTLTMVHDWAAIAAEMGDVLGQRIQTACAEALEPNVCR